MICFKNKDWHLNYQDSDYLKLLLARLDEVEEPLQWCMQFKDIINDNFPEGEADP